jgi:hypothetical protein
MQVIVVKKDTSVPQLKDLKYLDESFDYTVELNYMRLLLAIPLLSGTFMISVDDNKNSLLPARVTVAFLHGYAIKLHYPHLKLSAH